MNLWNIDIWLSSIYNGVQSWVNYESTKKHWNMENLQLSIAKTL